MSNIALMKDAAIMSFLNRVDDKVCVIAQKLRPIWTEELDADVIECSLSHWHQDTSDIYKAMDDPDDPNYSNNLELGKKADVSNIICDVDEMSESTIGKLKTRVDLAREESSASID